MADAANRKADPDFGDAGDIARDDPLFELAQIIGYGSRDEATDREPVGETQIDLEDALLRELDPQEDVDSHTGLQPVKEPEAEPETAEASEDVAWDVQEPAEEEPVAYEPRADEAVFEFQPPEPDEAVADEPEADWQGDLEAELEFSQEPVEEPVAEELYEAPSVEAFREEPQEEAVEAVEPAVTDRFPQEIESIEAAQQAVDTAEPAQAAPVNDMLEDELLAMLATLEKPAEAEASSSFEDDREPQFEAAEASEDDEVSLDDAELAESEAQEDFAEPEFVAPEVSEEPVQEPEASFAAEEMPAPVESEPEVDWSAVDDMDRGSEAFAGHAETDTPDESAPEDDWTFSEADLEPEAFADHAAIDAPAEPAPEWDAHDEPVTEAVEDDTPEYYQPAAPRSYATPLPIDQQPSAHEEPASALEAELAADDDFLNDDAIFSEFEEALSDDLALSLDERSTAPADWDMADDFEAEPETDSPEIPDFDAAFAAALELDEPSGDQKSEAEGDGPPILGTVDMPAGNVPAMEPLDLPELPAHETEEMADLDIESELTAALSGFDNFEMQQQQQASNVTEFRQPAPTTDWMTAARAQGNSGSFDIDTNSFEDDLARDLEFVSHDLKVEEGVGYEEFDGYNAPGEEQSSRRSSRGLIIAAVVGGVAILGVVGAFGLYSDNTVEGGGPVLVKADSEPVKVVPDDPGGTTVPNQDRAVYGEVDGSGNGAPTQEELVSTSEEPIDLSSQILPPGVRRGVDNGDGAEAGETVASGKSEERLQPQSEGFNPEEFEPQGETAALEPRRVRTVIVKPDGSFVAKPVEPQPQAAAPSSAADAVQSASSTEAAPTLEAASAESARQEAGTEQVVESAEDATTEQAAAVAGAQVPATDAKVEERLEASAEDTPAVDAQVPVRTAPTTRVTPNDIRERPADQPVTILNQGESQVASAPQASQPAAAPAQAAQTSEYSVQIASQPSAASAQQTANSLTQRYSSILGGRGVSIVEAEIEGKGTYHRVRISASSRQDAIDLCERYKAAGGSCFVAR